MNGIKRELTKSYTPRQNGVTKWKSRTIVEMVMSMLKTKQLGNVFWDKAIQTSVHTLMNHGIMKKIQKYSGMNQGKQNLMPS
jgi:hypothetical protein